MKKYFNLYCFFIESLQELRKKAGLSVAQLCADSHVSTRTYAKFSKQTLVKFECCFRLVVGSCKGTTKEEFLEFWEGVGTEIYDYYSES